MVANIEASTQGPASPVRSGRYQFRYWHYDGVGGRIALTSPPNGREGAQPDLINTAYRNGDGSRTVYGITFDLDAHRADSRWVDSEGCLDWPRISSYLNETHEELFLKISHAVRSTGGKGIALVIAINPLPIRASTAGNQRAAQNLQSRLIGFFNSLGLGADPNARGLERDFPNFQNSDRCLYENRLAMRRPEQAREPVITALHAYLNHLAVEARREKRIYPDARAEAGLAKLITWLLGIFDPGLLGVWTPGHLTGGEVWASTKTLQAITGLSDKFLRRFLKHPPAWLRVAYVQGEGWRLHMPLGRAVQSLLPRAESLLATIAPFDKAPKLLFSVATLPRPNLVEDGERNGWLTALALAYKWHGYARDEALAKILLRMEAIPGQELSRNCRQVRAIVKAIYKNVPETFGRFQSRDLPEWMVDDKEFGKNTKGTKDRRGVAPAAFLDAEAAPVLSPTPPKPALLVAGLSEVVVEILSGQTHLPEGPLVFADTASSSLAGKKLALVVIRWQQRVGIFDGDRLVLCTTKRHYRASAAMELLNRRQELWRSDNLI